MTKAELIALVQQYLEANEASFVANIPTFIKNTEEEIFRQVQLPDLMQTSTANFIVNNDFLPLPDDFLSPYSLAVVVAGEYRMMLSKDHSFIRETYSNPANLGVPRFYAVFDDKHLLIGPRPDQSYTAELNYFYMPASLVEQPDNGKTWLSEFAEEALLFGTILQGYVYLKGDQDVIAAYTEKYQSAMASLKIIAEGRNRKDSYRQADRRLPV